jgi:hypothetical protein
MGAGYENSEGAKYYYGWLDYATKRAHAVTGRAIGHLDGPFSRARFAGWGYNFNPINVFSPDKRYMYVTEKWQGTTTLRVLDFKEQFVRTIMPIPSNSTPGLTFTPEGKLLMLTPDCVLRVMDSSGIIESTTQLDTAGVKLGFYRELGIAYDEVHNRLYCGQSTGSWYVFYWDLADKSFHGVVPIDSVHRWKDVPGPFEGTNFYYEGSVLTFGPDDPEKRFLYMTHVDTYQLHRLDLQRRMVAALLQEGSTVRFSDSAKTNVGVYASSFRFEENGNFSGCSHSPSANTLFKRIK